MIGYQKILIYYAIALIAIGATPAMAQTFPSKPIRIVVGYAAGGPGDISARLIAQKVSETLGQPVVVENKPGASTIISAQAVANAPKDGYTLLMYTSVLVTNVHMYKTLPYKLEDFTPVSLILSFPFALNVSTSLPVKSLAEFVALAKSKPGSLNYATLGPSGTGFLLTKKFEKLADIKMTPIPYKGAAPAMTALTVGEVQVFIDSVSTSIPNHQARKSTMLGVTTEQRLPSAPDIPTFKEQNYPDMVASVWFGLGVPSGTPEDIVKILHGAIAKAVRSEDYQRAISRFGALPIASESPAEFSNLVRTESEKWSNVIRPLGIQLDY